MDSCEEVNFLSEWEYFEESEFLDNEGEEDYRPLKMNSKAWTEYFGNKDAFLDYAFLYLKPLENEEKKARSANVKPLEIRAFEILEHFRNVSSFGFSDPRSSKYPLSLRLFSISHPHCKSQQLSFGGLESDHAHVYNLNLSYGQNDTGMLGGKEPFVEHSIATCKGSSGAPIFLYMYNH